jgi:hypothetical protein
MRLYLTVAREHSQRPMGAREMRMVLNGYGRWAAAVGEPGRGEKLLIAHRGCQALKQQVRAAYRLRSGWEHERRVWRVVLRLDNQTEQAINFSTYGTVRATGPTGRPAPGIPKIPWGGSSSDSLAMPANRVSHRLIFLGDDPTLHTSPTTSIQVNDIEVVAYPPDIDAWWCSLPVPQLQR